MSVDSPDAEDDGEYEEDEWQPWPTMNGDNYDSDPDEWGWFIL